jgi:hypothetical protein
MSNEELQSARKKAACLLQKVIEGELSPKQARSKWPKYDGDIALDSVFHLLYHFEDDEDIRKKDVQYAEWQVGEIEKYILAFLKK